MLTNPRDAAIARTIVELGRSLGLTVIAEGVENDLQRQMLAAFGCHVFQGSLFGWAEPVESLVKLAHSAPVGLPEAPANR
jgi:EAL domain-containing protein (putative c-di-GMP-specific phosphodiesterase class I)